jgi:glycosyltransferase involved in cell wall biosynthesis
MPLVTVLMPVHNAGSFLRQAIDSILCQTQQDFEFVIVDDGSTDDDTHRILQEALSDKRVKLLSHPRRMGVACSLNHGMDAATGEFIARMDADDISHNRRFDKQIEFLRKHPAVGLCGTAVECFGRVEGLRIIHPENPDEIKCRLLLACPISHPTVMFRTASVQRHHLRYDEAFETAEDYALWTRCAACFPMANLREPLLYYRIHANQDERNPSRPIFLKKVIRSLWNSLGFPYSEEEVDGFFQLAHYADSENSANAVGLISCVESAFAKILQANEAVKKYDPEVLKRTLSSFWKTTLAGEQVYSWSIWRRYQRNAYSPPAFSDAIRLLIKCLIRWEARDPRRLLRS